MKAEQGELQRSFGEIRLFPESLDDLWHLSHLVAPGDLVFATTLRTADVPQDRARPEKAEKRPVRLGIRVAKVEFHRSSNRLRIFGVIEQGVDLASHHTLNIEPGYEISVIRRWRPADLERIERAVRASFADAVHILTIEEGDAELFRMRQYGPEGIVTVTSGSGKESGKSSRAEFFGRVASHLAGITGPLVIAGPGFIKDDFATFLKSACPEVSAKAMIIETRRTGTGAVQEVVGLGTLDRIQEDLQLSHEVRLMNEFLERLAKDLPVAYGRAEVRRAIDYGACERLLVADTLIHDEAILHLMDRADLSNARIVVFSTAFDPGRQLEGLGGIAALLRFRVE